MAATVMMPQQRLLLEILVMSGQIAVVSNSAGPLLARTLRECQDKGLATAVRVSTDIFSVDITDRGRQALATASPLR